MSDCRPVIDHIEFVSELFVTRGHSTSETLWEHVRANKQCAVSADILTSGNIRTRQAGLQQHWSTAQTTSCAYGGDQLLSELAFSEREPTFTFAICCRPSVCRLSVVSNVRASYSGGSNFRQYFYGIRYLGHPLTSTENFTEIVPGEPLRRGS